MRQIGTFETAEAAQRFTAYLLTQNIAASAEAEGTAWAIWVRNEDQLSQAKEAFDHFREAPNDARYSGVEAKAAQIQRADEQRRKQARKNVVEMRGQWKDAGAGGSAFKQAPLTCVLIGLSLFVAFLTRLGEGGLTPAQSFLNFCEISTIDGQTFVPRDGFAQIKQGQIWRLVTPIFLHFGLMHLAFNMFLLFSFGRRIEARYGTWRMGLMVLVMAVASNVSQYYWEASPVFGGMSGVVYGLLGFLWMKMLYDPGSGMWIHPFTLMFALVMLFVNMAAEVPPFDQYLGPALGRIANTAHFVGLAAGMAIAVIPIAFRRAK